MRKWRTVLCSPITMFIPRLFYLFDDFFNIREIFLLDPVDVPGRSLWRPPKGTCALAF